MKAFIQQKNLSQAFLVFALLLVVGGAQIAKADRSALSEAEQAEDAKRVEANRIGEVFYAAFELDALVNAGQLSPEQSKEILKDLEHVDFEASVNISVVDTPQRVVEKIMTALKVKRLTAVYLAARSGRI